MKRMKTRVFIALRAIGLLCAALGLTALVTSAAAIDGKWTAEVQGRNGTQTRTLTLKADGSKLTGTLDTGRGGATDITEGKIDGVDVTFKTTRAGTQWRTTTTAYAGKLMGDELDLTPTREGGAAERGAAAGPELQACEVNSKLHAGPRGDFVGPPTADLPREGNGMRNGLLSAMSAGVVLAAGMFFGHVRAAGPEFEVANITPAAQPSPELFRSGKIHIGMTSDATRVDIGGMPLTTAIQQAFRVKPFQVAAPDWARESRWDILAKIPEGGSQEQIPEMLQALLADRFKLVIHHEQREQPVYELVVGKGGPKLEASEAGDEAAGNATAVIEAKEAAMPLVAMPVLRASFRAQQSGDCSAAARVT